MALGRYLLAAPLLYFVISANAAQTDPSPPGVSPVEQPVPASGQTTPASEQTEPQPEEKAPEVEQPAAETEQAAPTAAQADPAVKNTSPVDEEDSPPAQETDEKLSEQASNTGEDSIPASEETTPIQVTEKNKSTGAPAEQPMDMNQVIALLQQQQKDLAEQRQLLADQSNQIKNLQAELDVLRAPTPVAQAKPQEQIVAKVDTVTQPLDTGQMQQEDEEAAPPKSKVERKEEDRKAGQEVARAQADDPTRQLLSEFPGAWRLPGTNAALAIGGFVKSTVVYNFDPLEIKDRFIVGSIPVGDTSDIEAQSSITASQSRLNFDLREPTDFGLMRAFIEGDFASDNDTFRLRHAFGQWNKVLAGKTWSAFVDTQASPEEVDFEGLNGRINVRQSQIRIMPTIGQNYEFQVSLEDPNPQIQNGQGVTRAPDIVATGRFQLLDRLHVKLGLLGRQIRGQRDDRLGGGLDKSYAWGTTVSGRFMTPLLDERDSLLFQLNVGNGIGRYVNDLSSVGNFDGIFNPDDGDLELFDIMSGYVSWQHWWRGNLRSNFTFGMVEVDNPNFVSGDAYKTTVRGSTNLFWMPSPRIDIGAEYLWGKRENEDGENDTATQFQLAARYRF